MSPHVNEYVIKARRSTDDEINQKNSLEYQVEQCQKYALTHGLRIADLTIPGFIDHGIVQERHTAYKTADLSIDSKGRVIYKIERPKFQQLVALLADRKVRGVIVLCWDRLSRNSHDDAIIKNLISRGIDIRFVQAAYDNTSAGALHMDIDGMFAAHSSRVTSEKVKGTYAKLRSEGKCTYRSPVGYLDGGPDQKSIDPQRASLVRQLFELYATESWSIQQLAIWAKQHGLTAKPRRRCRTRSEIREGMENSHQPVSRFITRTGISSILTNPFYIGYIRHHREWLPGTHQPLIEQNLFYRVQKVLKKRCVGFHYENKMFFLYRGLIVCQCGRRYSPYEQKGHAYYRSSCLQGCSNAKRNIREEQVDELIAQLLGRLSLTPREALFLNEKIPKAMNRWKDEHQRRCSALSARRTRTLMDLSYLANNKTALLREGVYTMTSFVQEETHLIDERDEIDRQLLVEKGISPAEMVHTVDDVLELAKLAKDSYILASREQKHSLLQMAFLELTIINQEIAKFSAKEGVDELLNRKDVLYCAPNDLIHELPNLYNSALLVEKIMKHFLRS